jgi:hypothetical protein
MKVCSCNAWFSRDIDEYAFGGGWGVGVRKGDSECSGVGVDEEEEGNWEKRWRVEEPLGEWGVVEVDKRSRRCAKAFYCYNSSRGC